jgi:hypothetical protein
MTRGRGQAARSTAALLRESLVALAALNTGGLALELASLRHWKSPVQLIPWAAVVVLAAAAVLLAVFPERRTVRAVRVLAGCVAVIAAVGVYEHVKANYQAGPLDFRYADRWATMPVWARLWAAVSGSVGPAPAFAPAVLAIAALCLWFATLRHPRLTLVTDRSHAHLVRAGGFIVDLAARRAMTRTGEVRLTPTEWHLLEVLARQPGRVLSPVQLSHALWPGPASGRRLDDITASMARLRRKLEPDPARPRHLLTEPGMGYRFQP